MPWREPGSRVTALFEALAIDERRKPESERLPGKAGNLPHGVLLNQEERISSGSGSGMFSRQLPKL